MLDKLRSYRIYSMAIFDWVITIIISLIIIKKFKLNVFKTFILIIPLIVIFHKIFQVNSVISSLFDNTMWMKLLVQLSIIIYIFL